MDWLYLISFIGVIVMVGSMWIVSGNVMGKLAKKAYTGVVVGFILAAAPLLYIFTHNIIDDDNSLTTDKIASYVSEEYGLTDDQYVMDMQSTGSSDDDFIYIVKSPEYDLEIYVKDSDIIGSKKLSATE